MTPSKAPHIACSTPLPPWPGAAAELGAAILRVWLNDPAIDRRLVPLVENPFQVSGGILTHDRIRPVADLPWLVAGGAEGSGGAMPVYLVADGPEHVHQLSAMARCPGVLVLLDERLDGLAERCVLGERPLFPEWQRASEAADGDLALAVARHSLAVVVGDAATAARLKDAGVTQPVEVVPALAADELAASLPRLVDEAAAHRDAVAPAMADEPPQKVAAVVVSFNSRAILDPCLEALAAQDLPGLEVVVVDNASVDGTADHVAANHPDVRLIRSAKNLGFAGGNNLAFRTTDADYVVMVNQDAIPRRNMIRELVRVARWDPEAGAVGAKMLMARCPTLINSTGLEMNEGGWAWDRGVGEKDVPSDPYPERVLAGCGGALLFRKAALQRCGGLDEAYFMYFEDTDLCLRMALAGFHNHYAPLATCRHDYHGDALEDPERDHRRRYLSERNRWQTLLKNWSWKTLRELYPRIRQHERGRAAALRRMVAEGNNAELAGRVLAITKQARRWNILHAPGLLWRRLKAQRVRRVPDAEVRALLVEGVAEGGHQGDVESFHDRFSATPRTSITMGDTDAGAIGSGWHPVEHPDGAPRAWRWCKGTAWFYLQPEPQHRELVAQLYSPTEPHAWSITAETTRLGGDTADNKGRPFRLALPEDLPRGEVLEFRIDSEFLVPAERGLSEDRRELGIVVFGFELR